jgi:hypothetical protein
MSSTVSHGPGKLQQKLQLALQGVQSMLQPGSNYVLGGTSYTGTSLYQLLAAWAAVFTAAITAQSAAKTALAQRRAIEPAVRAFLQVLHEFVTSQYGATSQDLTKFGFTPKKVAKPLTSEQQVVKKVKAKQTREERGTLGSNQKKSVHAATPSAVTITDNGVAQIVTPPGGTKSGS